MKKLLFLVGLTISINASAQVSLDHTYSNAGINGELNSSQRLFVVHLEIAGDKFVFHDNANRRIRMYNLDHSHWKTISFTNAIDMNPSSNSAKIFYISQRLFNLDDKIEFLYVDINSTSGAVYVTQIMNEDNEVLFTANDQAPLFSIVVPQEAIPIYNTSGGTFMILSGTGSGDGNAYVYSLVGTLSSGISPGPVHEIAALSAGLAYPNPTANTTRIDYALPTGVNEGFIVLYTTGGQEVKRFSVDRTFNTLEISTADLQSGTYYYNLQTVQGVSGGNRLVTVR